MRNIERLVQAHMNAVVVSIYCRFFNDYFYGENNAFVNIFIEISFV